MTSRSVTRWCLGLILLASSAAACLWSQPAAEQPIAQEVTTSAGDGRDAQPQWIVLCQATEPIEIIEPGGEIPWSEGALPSGAACGPACERRIDGVDCLSGDGCGEPGWGQWGPIPWQALSQGEYIGPARSPHVPDYRLRVDDEIEFVYVLTRAEEAAYRLQVGDAVKVESSIDPAVNREVTVQPDGTIDLYLLGPVKSSRMTVEELKAQIDERYKKFYKVADFSIQRTKTNTRLDDLRDAVDNRFFSGGQGRRVRVTPEGTVSLPEIGNVYVQGLSLDEVRREVNERYAGVVQGLSVTPALAQRAPRYVYVVGEVLHPGRFTLESPTTAMGAVALAGGWKNGANLRQIVVFRRADDWRLLATKLDIRGALYGKRPSPADEIFLRDSDVVVVPKSSIQATDDLLELVFSHGIYRAFPVFFVSRL
ncbi:MAG: polysaccharide biosynthesis/export family protein [Pirellulaceae bacterium]